jgi:hypothetical protein
MELQTLFRRKSAAEIASPLFPDPNNGEAFVPDIKLFTGANDTGKKSLSHNFSDHPCH